MRAPFRGPPTVVPQAPNDPKQRGFTGSISQTGKLMHPGCEEQIPTQDRVAPKP